eukprot:1933637-Prymnesium_polylepis.1
MTSRRGGLAVPQRGAVARAGCVWPRRSRPSPSGRWRANSHHRCIVQTPPSSLCDRRRRGAVE